MTQRIMIRDLQRIFGHIFGIRPNMSPNAQVTKHVTWVRDNYQIIIGRIPNVAYRIWHTEYQIMYIDRYIFGNRPNTKYVSIYSSNIFCCNNIIGKTKIFIYFILLIVLFYNHYCQISVKVPNFIVFIVAHRTIDWWCAA